MSDDAKKKRILEARKNAGAEVATLIDAKFKKRGAFAYEIGVTEKTLSDIVNGRKKIDTEISQKLSSVLQKPESYFLELYNEKINIISKSEPNTDDYVEKENNGQPIKFTKGDRTVELPEDSSPDLIEKLFTEFFDDDK